MRWNWREDFGRSSRCATTIIHVNDCFPWFACTPCQPPDEAKGLLRAQRTRYCDQRWYWILYLKILSIIKLSQSAFHGQSQKLKYNQRRHILATTVTYYNADMRDPRPTSTFNQAASKYEIVRLKADKREMNTRKSWRFIQKTFKLLRGYSQCIPIFEKREKRIPKTILLTTQDPHSSEPMDYLND